MKKPNIFGLEPVIIDHPKTASKLSKSIKNQILLLNNQKQSFIQDQMPLIVHYN